MFMTPVCTTAKSSEAISPFFSVYVGLLVVAFHLPQSQDEILTIKN